MAELRIPAVEFRQKKNTLYLFCLPADKLIQLVKSDPKVSTNPEGIQRLLSKSRLKQIADYISKQDTCFPNNIIVNFTSQVKYVASNSKGMGELVFPSEQGHYGDILDGQHRLYGIAHEASLVKDMIVPVTGLILDDAKSAGRIFADINRLQKPVSKLLLVSLQRELGDLVDSKDNAAAIVEQLNEDSDSPLHQRLKMYQDEKGDSMSYDQAINVLAPLFDKGQRLYFLSADIALARIKNYLWAVAETFPTAWADAKNYRLTNVAGFEVIIGLFERAHERARNMKSSDGPTKEDFKAAIEPISETDWSAETFKDRGYTGSAGRKILLKELLDELPPE